jgi:excisionase family DNA binding protein
MLHGFHKRHDLGVSKKEGSPMTRTNPTPAVSKRKVGHIELLTIDDVAALLKVPKSTLYQWSYQGEGPPVVRIGRHLRYPRDLLDDWIDSGMKQRHHES